MLKFPRYVGPPCSVGLAKSINCWLRPRRFVRRPATRLTRRCGRKPLVFRATPISTNWVETICGGKDPRTKMKALLLLILFPLMPAKAEQPDIQCPGKNTYEMRWCASQKWEESNHLLKNQLDPETLNTWVKATQEVCTAAYSPYKQGTIYPQLVVGCDDRLNRFLLEEFKGLGG